MNASCRMMPTTFRQALLTGIFSLMLSVPCLGDTLRVAVASNFASVLQQLAQSFEVKSGHVVVISPGSTGRHYTQIINGAPFDLFMAADSERPYLLEQTGQAVSDTRFTYALGRIVLWSPDPDLIDTDGQVLQTGSFRHLAIANPRLAPYGQAAREVLEHLQLWQPLQNRLVQGENIAQTLQFVESGNAELGFIASAQWLEIDTHRAGSLWEPPVDSYHPLEQQAILLRESAAGRDFMRFLQGEAARSLIMAAGYGLP
jgi:molybdate transport system substrate-binding protein